MPDRRFKTGWGAVLLYACLAVVLVAATVQAAHICGLNDAPISASAQDEGTSSSSAMFCTICMIAHSITAALIVMLLFSPLLRRAPVRSASHVAYIPFTASFKLCVRPPPAWL